MRKFLVFVLCALTVSLACAADVVTLPINFDKGVPIVTMSLNGKEYPFMIDSGASDALYLSDVAAKQISGLTYTGKKLKSFDLTGQVQEADEIVVNDLVVNGLHFGKTSGRIYVPWGMNLGTNRGLSPDISVIGIDFFAGKKVLLDFAAKIMQLTDGDTATITKNDNRWISVPYERTSEGMVLEVKSEERRYRMILDSPASLSIVNPKRVQNHEEIGKCKLNLGPDRICQYIAISVPGGSELTPILINLSEKFKEDGILGRDFFERYSVLLDTANRTLQIKSHL